MNSILIILLSIILSVYFSGMEIAFRAAGNLKKEPGKKQERQGSVISRRFARDPGQFKATMLTGYIIALVLYGISSTRLLTPVLLPLLNSRAAVLLINILISGVILFMFAGIISKLLFSLVPGFFLRFFGIPALFFHYLFFPVSRSILKASDLIIRPFSDNTGLASGHENHVFGTTDPDHLIDMSKQINKESGSDHRDIRIFRNALDFSNVRLRECMIPRTEIVACEINEPVSGLKEKFVETGYSRILVYSGSIDNITGYFELKDIFRNPPDIGSGMRKLAIVPETMPASKLLRLFVEDKRNIALVVDEFGGTSGMVTIEDVLEEIVGDIEDEHDTNELIEKKINDTEYVFSARLEIDYLNETYGLGLPEGDEYETLAGLILFRNGNIPASNEIIKIQKFHFRILRVSATRLELVKLKIEH